MTTKEKRLFELQTERAELMSQLKWDDKDIGILMEIDRIDQEIIKTSWGEYDECS